MFGYIRPYVPELKVKEHEAYKNVYCGLCHKLGNSFGKWTRLTLSYDFTFLAMVYYQDKDIPVAFSQKRCAVNPLTKVYILDDNEGLSYAADVAMLMTYYKIYDNIADSTFIKKLGWQIMAKIASKDKKKAANNRPHVDSLIAEMMKKQALVESANINSIDAACEPTAFALSQIMREMSDNDVSEKFGYLVGRYIYLCDAMDDLQKDLKKNEYNPFVVKYIADPNNKSQINSALSKAKDSLFMTIGELIMLSEKMQFKLFAPIIYNTIQLGMKNCVLEIYNKESGVIDESI